MEKSVLVAAIDFSEDYSQISYFDGRDISFQACYGLMTIPKGYALEMRQ